MAIGRILNQESRFALSRKIMDSPVAGPYMRLRMPYQHTMYIPRCDVIVDGFPRSANTYVWFAMKSSLEPKYMVRGHTHSVATLKAGIRSGKPTMLLVREPEAVAASLYQLASGVSLSACFDAYTQFHTKCLTLKQDLHIAHFQDVVNDLGAVLDGFYKTYDLDWPRYEKTDVNEAGVNDAIEYANRRRNDGQIREAGIARPSAQRASSKELLQDLSQKEERARAAAKSVYDELSK